jgi:hypothetical protein
MTSLYAVLCRGKLRASLQLIWVGAAMEAQPQQHEAPAHMQNGLHGLSNGLHLDVPVQQPAVAEQQATHGGAPAADGAPLAASEALPLPAVLAPDAAQEQQQQQQPEALPEQAAHPHLHLLQTAADQQQPAALQLPPPRGLPPAGQLVCHAEVIAILAHYYTGVLQSSIVQAIRSRPLASL